ncbi:fibronectin type III/BRCA1 domain-containing protein [Mycena alexandri]|uniref:Fibronectin type III/BRCA1 domain-containing protein n=1 Tax=Mycena alexandri TaxID=1745969 RepID=A0AAD6TE01_9AGAR|nr:fibronectin type III/BRCA1 domain-containing protein [Mycena alexandri]
MEKLQESFTFTVGKLDAGMAILLGERAHLIEFPSILLPPGATTGSIVNIAVHQNHAEERRRDAEFWALQDEILQEFGVNSPEPPQLQLRNVTQTSITLEWPPIQLATAKLRSLDIYRNGQRLAPIPSPLTNTSSKLSGLELNTEYTFQLILRTTAGTFPSNLIRVRTHTMADTSGISVCFGTVGDEVMLENAKMALREMGARWSDKIQIDTTHFVCTTPNATLTSSSGGSPVAPGVEYQRAMQLSIPVVQPHWVFACHTERKLVSIAAYNLGATPPTPAPSTRPQSMSQASQAPRASPASGLGVRQSMPPLARGTEGPQGTASSFVNASSSTPPLASTAEDAPAAPNAGAQDGEDADAEAVALERAVSSAVMEKRMSRTGTMNREFKFPTPVSSPTVESYASSFLLPPPLLPYGTPNLPNISSLAHAPTPRVVTPSNIEVPPPPPVEKELAPGMGMSGGGSPRSELGEEELGDTVDIPLN